MFWKRDIAARTKLTTLETQVLDLTARRRELEVSLEQQKLELEIAQNREDMKYQSERQNWVQEKKAWEQDIDRVKANAADDQERAIAETKKRAELEMLETRTMMKLEAEQKIAKAILDAEKSVIAKNSEISDLKKLHAEEMAAQKSKLTKEHYDNLKSNLENFHNDGNTTTKFMKELSLEMLRSRPKHDMLVGVQTGALED